MGQKLIFCDPLVYAVEKGGLADDFCLKRSPGALEVEILEGLDGVVGVTPAAGGVVEGLVGEEVLMALRRLCRFC